MGTGRHTGKAAIACFLVACAGEAPDPDGRALVSASLAAIGGVPEEGILLVTGGTLDKGPEGQGFTPDGSSPGEFRERIAVDPGTGLVARHYREDRFDGTFEWVGEVRGPGEERVTLLPAYAVAIRARDPDTPEAAARVRRRVPHFLLAELLADSIAFGGVRAEGAALEVDVTLTGAPATLGLSAADSTPISLTLVDDLEGFGPSEIRWSFMDWTPAAGGRRYPRWVTMHVGGRRYLDLDVRVESLVDSVPFVVPDSFRVVEVPASVTEGADEPLVVDTVAPGVYQVLEVRGGFAPLFVELADFIVAVDAPGGFPLLAEVPPGHTDPAPTWSHHSERFVDAIRATVPEKPVRYLVLTHGHQDHVAGARAFVAVGATVLGPPALRDRIGRLVTSEVGITTDRLARAPRPLVWESVASVRTISDGARAVRLLPVATPHAAEALVVEVADADLMFVSDLVTPTRLDRYPLPDVAPLDRAFARWLERERLDPGRILAMHGSGEVTAEHRARALATDGGGLD